MRHDEYQGSRKTRAIQLLKAGYCTEGKRKQFPIGMTGFEPEVVLCQRLSGQTKGKVKGEIERAKFPLSHTRISVSRHQSLDERLHYHCQTVLTAILSDFRSVGTPPPRLEATVAFSAVHKGFSALRPSSRTTCSPFWPLSQ